MHLSTVGTLVLTMIFAFAAALVALPQMLARRERKRRGSDAAVTDDAPSRPRLRDRLGRSRAAFTGLGSRLRARGTLDDEAWDELEETLLLADVGMETATDLLTRVQARVS